MTDPGTDNAAPEAAPDDPAASAIDSASTETASTADAPNASADNAATDGGGTVAGNEMSSGSPASAELENAAYDFRQPARLAEDVATSVGQWQKRIASLLPEKLSSHVPSLRCDAAPPEVGPPDKVAPPHPLLAFRVLVADAHETILGIHRPLAVTLVTAMLGESPETLCEDRELTLVEQSLFELVVRDLVELLDESGQPLGISVKLIGGERRTQFIRLFPPNQSISMLKFQLDGDFGGALFCWTWPQGVLEALMESNEPPAASPHLPELAQRMPFEVVVRLGSAHLTVQQLTQLKPGDIVVLDQPVAEPLVADIGGQEKLRVWPGREGHRLAVQVAEVVED